MMKKATVTAVAVDAINLKRFASLVLIVAAAVSLCACRNTGASDTASSSKPTPTVTPEYLWATEFKDINNLSVEPHFLCFGDNELYCYGYEKVGEDIPDEAINKAKKEGKEVENDGRWDVLETRLIRIDFNGNSTDLNGYTAMPEAENTLNWKNFDSASGIGGMTVDDNGGLYIFEYVYSSGSSAPDKKEDWIAGEDYKEFSNTWYIRTLSENGEEINASKINLPTDMAIIPDSFVKDKNGFTALVSCGNKSGIISITGDGTINHCVLSDIQFDGIMSTRNGEVIVYSKADDLTTIYSIDTAKEKLTVKATLNKADKLFSGSETADFYYSSGVEFYSYYDGKEHNEYNWTTVNIDTSEIASPVYSKDNNLFVFLTNSGKIAEINRMYYAAETERKALKLAAFNPSNELIAAVSEFNKNNYGVRIDVEDYSKFADGKTGLSALYEYCNNHLGGQLPDIIELSSFSLDTLAEKNIIQDLYTYIDADNGINRDDYFENTMKACEIDGKLYCTCSGFSLNCVIGLEKTIGSSVGWTYDDYYKALSSMPYGSTGFDYYTTQSTILENLLEIDLNQFIDKQEKTCNFTDGRFEKLLNFVKTFPEYYDYASDSSSAQQSRDMLIRDGRQMLLISNIYGFDDFMMAGYEFDDDIIYIGYPTLLGTGNSIEAKTFSSGGNLAMSSTCADTVAAWSFLRNFFTEEYQEKCSFFPSYKNVFERKLNEAMITTPVLNKDGEQLYDDDGLPRIYAVGTMYLSDFTPVPYYPITEKQAESLRNLITTTTKVRYSNEDIIRIIKNNYRSENACQLIQEQVYSYLNS